MPDSIWDQDLTSMGLDATMFKGKVTLLVNTASKCGYTYQLTKLQQLHDCYAANGFTVLAVPSKDYWNQEFDHDAEVCDFYASTHGVNFPISKISDVANGGNPLHRYVADTNAAQPEWNFHKVLIGRDGTVIGSWHTKVEPNDPSIIAGIEKALSDPVLG